MKKHFGSSASIVNEMWGRNKVRIKATTLASSTRKCSIVCWNLKHWPFQPSSPSSIVLHWQYSDSDPFFIFTARPIIQLCHLSTKRSFLVPTVYIYTSQVMSNRPQCIWGLLRRAHSRGHHTCHQEPWGNTWGGVEEAVGHIRRWVAIRRDPRGSKKGIHCPFA